MYCVVFPGSKTQAKTQKSENSGERMSVLLVPNLDLGVGVRTPEERKSMVATQSADPAGGLFVCFACSTDNGVR